MLYDKVEEEDYVANILSLKEATILIYLFWKFAVKSSGTKSE